MQLLANLGLQVPLPEGLVEVIKHSHHQRDKEVAIVPAVMMLRVGVQDDLGIHVGIRLVPDSPQAADGGQRLDGLLCRLLKLGNEVRIGFLEVVVNPSLLVVLHGLREEALHAIDAQRSPGRKHREGQGPKDGLSRDIELLGLLLNRKRHVLRVHVKQEQGLEGREVHVLAGQSEQADHAPPVGPSHRRKFLLGVLAQFLETVLGVALADGIGEGGLLQALQKGTDP